jgi:hypothetical protein
MGVGVPLGGRYMNAVCLLSLLKAEWCWSVVGTRAQQPSVPAAQSGLGGWLLLFTVVLS